MIVAELPKQQLRIKKEVSDVEIDSFLDRLSFAIAFNIVNCQKNNLQIQNQ